MYFLPKAFRIQPFNSLSDRERISPYNINTVSGRQVRRIKKKTQLGDYKLIQYQILRIGVMSILWQKVGRISNEILGVEGLKIKCGGNVRVKSLPRENKTYNM